MTRLDEIIANALAGIPETDAAILAREVVRLRGERAVVVPEPDANSAGLVEVRSWIGAIGPVGAMVWVNPWEAMKVAGVRAIPSDRVLEDGMVAMSAIKRKCQNDDEDAIETLALCGYGEQAELLEAAIRANQGGADHA